MSTYKKRVECASCSNKNLLSILDYNEVPLAGYFPSKDEVEQEELYSLCILFCDKCFLVQTDSIIDADKLFKDYRYMSSIGLSKHFNGVAKYLKEKFNLDEDSSVVEIGSNDGVLLKPLLDNGIKAIGFEPAVNISKIARDKGVDVITDYFNESTASKYLEASSVDLFVSNNCFAHIDDIKSLIRGIKSSLNKDGHFVFEVSYLKDLIQKNQYDNIYHEHIYYYSLIALNNLFAPFEMTIVDFDLIPIHSGSIRVIVKNGIHKKPDKVEKFLSDEVAIGMDNFAWFENFSKEVKRHTGVIKSKIKELKESGLKLVGYGASGRANMTCNICNLTKDDIAFIVDESPERIGRFIPGSKIPIVSKEHLLNSDADCIVIFAWNFADMIKSKLTGINYKFVVFFPEFEMQEQS